MPKIDINRYERRMEMSEKTIAVAFLLGTLCLALLATIMFPDLPGLP